VKAWNSTDRRQFIGGSDARIIMDQDEKALIRLWHEKRGESGHQGFFGFGAAARPYPKSRRKASLRDFTSLYAAHLSTALMTGFGRRTATAGSWPVAGRPRPFFFLFTDIDLAIFCVYKKYVEIAEDAANTLRGQPDPERWSMARADLSSTTNRAPGARPALTFSTVEAAHTCLIERLAVSKPNRILYIADAQDLDERAKHLQQVLGTVLDCVGPLDEPRHPACDQGPGPFRCSRFISA
jgi:hypothetical protein